jgi:hypothetical protein
VCRRAEFTRICFERLIKNTDWNLISKVIIIHDMPKVHEELKIATESEDTECKKILQGAVKEIKLKEVGVHYKEMNFGSVAGCQKYAMDISESEYFLKVDSDVAVCKGWLPRLLEVMESYKELIVLGYGLDKTDSNEAVIKENLEYGYVPVHDNGHVGGLVIVRMNKEVRESIKKLNHVKGQVFTGWGRFQRTILWKVGQIGWYWPKLDGLMVIDRLNQKQELIEAGFDYDLLVDLLT